MAKLKTKLNKHLYKITVGTLNPRKIEPKYIGTKTKQAKHPKKPRRRGRRRR